MKGLSAEQLREVPLRLITDFTEQQRLLEAKDRSIETLTRVVTFKTTKVDQLTHELAQYKRLRFGRSSEKLDAAQASLLDETFDADLAAIEEELKQLRPPPKAGDKQQPRRTALPADLPRVDVHHEPESTTCACGCALKRIGEDVAEKLDYVPDVFTIEQHVRGKWACAKCETLIQAPVPAQVIDILVCRPVCTDVGQESHCLAMSGSVRQKLALSSSPSSGRSGTPMIAGAMLLAHRRCSFRAYPGANRCPLV